LVKSLSFKFSLKSSAIDDDGSVKSSDSKSKKKGKKKEVRKMMKKDKKTDAQPEGDDAASLLRSILTPKGSKPRLGSVGALFKSFSHIKSEKDVDWDTVGETKEPIIIENQAKETALVEDVVCVDSSADSKRNKNKHDSSGTRSVTRRRSNRVKEGDTAPEKDTKKQPDMFGHSIPSIGADSILSKASSKKKSKGAGRRSSTSSSTTPSKSQPAPCSRKIKFIAKKSIANDMPGNDDDSFKNAATTLASSTRSRRSSIKQ
jgi:hypothetical protein